ncbi:MAG: HD domain-containing protein [Segniliparus sp.]|uniref:HD domain-containing protein n=1 Tax=Segniliparus sp. TaxID=2804064 RepID=UPI003F3A9826
MTLTEAQREDLVARWSQPHRRYHTFAHLTAVLAALDELAAAGTVFEDEPVRLAAWFHDAVYDPNEADNEASSAELASQTLGPGALAQEVARLVLLTAGHQVQPGDANGAALCDADLAVLGGEPHKYQAYAEAVRAEYAHVPEPLYHRGRADVLRSLLGHSAIFRTAYGAERWEKSARRNLEAEITALEA